MCIDISCGLTPNFPTDIIPTKIAWLKLSRNFPMDMRSAPLNSKIMLESNPLNIHNVSRQIGRTTSAPPITVIISNVNVIIIIIITSILIISIISSSSSSSNSSIIIIIIIVVVPQLLRRSSGRTPARVAAMRICWFAVCASTKSWSTIRYYSIA